jgi:hypothetical protein
LKSPAGGYIIWGAPQAIHKTYLKEKALTITQLSISLLKTAITNQTHQNDMKNLLSITTYCSNKHCYSTTTLCRRRKTLSTFDFKSSQGNSLENLQATSK